MKVKKITRILLYSCLHTGTYHNYLTIWIWVFFVSLFFPWKILCIKSLQLFCRWCCCCICHFRYWQIFTTSFLVLQRSRSRVRSDFSRGDHTQLGFGYWQIFTTSFLILQRSCSRVRSGYSRGDHDQGVVKMKDFNAFTEETAPV